MNIDDLAYILEYYGYYPYYYEESLAYRKTIIGISGSPVYADSIKEINRLVQYCFKLKHRE